MEKKCKVVLLPTENKTRIHKAKDNRIICSLGNYSKDNFDFDSNQHLYILSDDEIKEEDWFYRKEIGFKEISLYKAGIQLKNCKKVIATTNPNLIKEGVASIDDKFVKEYCNNPVEEVLVEYELYNTKPNALPIYGKFDYKLKLSSNGSIIIKPVEETWDDIEEEFLNHLKLKYPESKNNIGVHSLVDFAQEYRIWLKNNYEVPKKK